MICSSYERVSREHMRSRRQPTSYGSQCYPRGGGPSRDVQYAPRLGPCVVRARAWCCLLGVGLGHGQVVRRVRVRVALQRDLRPGGGGGLHLRRRELVIGVRRVPGTAQARIVFEARRGPGPAQARIADETRREPGPAQARIAVVLRRRPGPHKPGTPPYQPLREAGRDRVEVEADGGPR